MTAIVNESTRLRRLLSMRRAADRCGVGGGGGGGVKGRCL